MWQVNRGLQCRLGQKVTLSEKDSLEITRKALVNSLEKIEGFSLNSSLVWYSLLETVASRMDPPTVSLCTATN